MPRRKKYRNRARKHHQKSLVLMHGVQHDLNAAIIHHTDGRLNMDMISQIARRKTELEEYSGDIERYL